MDRLQKKCVIASAGVHLLLVIILFIGPAFISSSSKPDDLPVLDFVPVKTVDALVSGGGNPNARPPAALPEPPRPAPMPVTPPAPQPKPQPEKLPDPEPVKQPVKEVTPPKPQPDSLEPATEPKPKKPEISTKLVTRARDTRTDTKARAEARAREEARALEDARRRMADTIGKTVARLGSDMSGSTTVELKGPGGGGVPYANFLQAVKSVYARAWVVPDGVTDDDATAVVSVTIARDGKVISARITRSSGNSAVDRSVQATLDRVDYAAPLPDDAKENQRTVTINFNVRAKRLLG